VTRAQARERLIEALAEGLRRKHPGYLVVIEREADDALGDGRPAGKQPQLEPDGAKPAG